MGYSFTIGEGAFVETIEDGEPYSRWEVPEVRLSTAPVFDNDSLTGNSNSRHPSYTGWYEFCKKAGFEIFNLFYTTPRGHTGEGTLIPRHPGGAKLEQKHLDVIRKVRIEREKLGLVPGFADGQDYVLARLMWLEFWIDWALTNCKNPIFKNT